MEISCWVVIFFSSELIIHFQVDYLAHFSMAVFLRHLGSQLCELEKLIDKMMIAEFSTYARNDLNRPLEDDCQILEEVCLLLK